MLFQVLALAGYLVILFGFISGIYQWPVLITFATLPVIWKIFKRLNKIAAAEKFCHSIKNLMVFNNYALEVFISALLVESCEKNSGLGEKILFFRGLRQNNQTKLKMLVFVANIFELLFERNLKILSGDFGKNLPKSPRPID